MKTLRSCAVVFGLGCLLACRAEVTAPQPEKPSAKVAPAEPTARPSLSITRIGPNDIEGTGSIDLPEATVEVAGQAWNFAPDDETEVFYRRLGTAPWAVAGASPAESGGLFLVSAIRFPGTGDYEVIAGLFSAGDSVTNDGISDARLKKQARAFSGKLLVRVTESPRPLEGEGPDREVISVGTTNLDPQRTTLVPAQGDVLLRARNVPAETRIYLAIYAHSSDRACLLGPAQGSSPGQYLLPDVSLKVPGDPRNVHLGLIAVVSPKPLPTGPVNLAWLRQQDVMTSRSAEVLVDAGDRLVVPHIAITRIGAQTLGTLKTAGKSLAVETGDAVEVGQFARVPPGAQLWILTRPRESSRWLAQGPATLRSLQASDDPELGPPATAWVWPSTRFEHEKTAAGTEPSETAEEFEVMAVLSTARLPATWIDSSALASETVSEAVRVSTRPREPLSLQKISIARIGETDVDPESETLIGAVEPVEINAHQDLPPPYRIYLAWHPRGDASWTLVEAMPQGQAPQGQAPQGNAIPQGQSYVVPAISFVSSHPRHETHYELMALVTRGEMPEEQIGSGELAHSLVVRSDIIPVRYEPKSSAGITAWLRRLWSSQDEEPGEPEAQPEEHKSSWRIPMWIWIVLAVLLALIIGLALLEWKRGFIEPLAQRAAGRIDQAVKTMEEQLTRLPPTQPALFFLGVVLAASLLFVIGSYYLPLYAKAMVVVTSLPHKESEGLAVCLIFLTALAGIFLELTTNPEYGAAPKSTWLRIVMSMILGLILLGLMIFQAIFYYTFLNKTAAGMIPLLGGIAFFLIAFIEAMESFFVTRLTLHQLEPITIRFVRLLLVLLSLFFHTIARFLHEISQGKPKEEMK